MHKVTSDSEITRLRRIERRHLRISKFQSLK